MKKEEMPAFENQEAQELINMLNQLVPTTKKEKLMSILTVIKYMPASKVCDGAATTLTGTASVLRKSADVLDNASVSVKSWGTRLQMKMAAELLTATMLKMETK